MEISNGVNRKNIPLYIALAIPVVMIIAIAAFIYLPGATKQPKYNFLYMTGSNVYGYGSQQYVVSAGHLTQNPQPLPVPVTNYIPPQNDAHFYIYNVSTNQATEVSLAQAQSYTLSSNNTSPDGYTVQQGNSGGGDFLFGSGPNDYNNWFLNGYNRSRKLNIQTGSPNVPYNFQFLGWVD